MTTVWLYQPAMNSKIANLAMAAAGPSVSVDQLRLERREEALGYGIIQHVLGRPTLWHT